MKTNNKGEEEMNSTNDAKNMPSVSAVAKSTNSVNNAHITKDDENAVSTSDKEMQEYLRYVALEHDYMDPVFRKPELESWPRVSQKAAEAAHQDFLEACREQISRSSTCEDTSESLDARFEELDAKQLAKRIKTEVIGQDAAVERIAEYFMLRRAKQEKLAGGTGAHKLPTMNACLLMGPTAAGKGHILKASARALGNAKVFEIKCNLVTGTGWRGRTLDSELFRVAVYLKEHNGTQAIVFLDEVDKRIISESDALHDGFNPQPDIMAFVECEDVYEGQVDEGNKERYSIDMSRVFIVLAGAFTGIGKEVVARRLRRNEEGNAMLHASRDSAWSMSEDELREHVIPQDLVEYGLMPELLGRITSIINMPALSEDNLRAIVNSCENNLAMKISALLPQGVSFEVENEAASFVAHKAHVSELGARALEPQLHEVAAQAMATCRENESIRKARVFIEGDELALSYTTEDGNSYD